MDEVVDDPHLIYRTLRACLGSVKVHIHTWARNISLLDISKLVPMLVLEYGFWIAAGPWAGWSLLNDWFVRQKEYRVRISRRDVGCTVEI